jgi:NNP family nitrate/nitrite transporter-like MFS transporter
MHLHEFRRAGHGPSLLSAFVYFDVSFMVWMLLAALAPIIIKGVADPGDGSKLLLGGELKGISELQQGILLAIPPLGGAILRICLGLFTDRFGARKAGLVGQILTLIPLLLGWLWATSGHRETLYLQLLLVGLLLGVAGASFAAALPLASRWYPPKYQGLAMGIAGAGNSGTVFALFFGPRLASQWGWGWNNVFGLALIPMIASLVFFALFAKDSPNQPPARPLADYAKVGRLKDTWWFCLFYAVTFGGFVGLGSFVAIYFSQQYELNAANAGSLGALCVLSGSFLRPVGGYLADRMGGIRLLTVLYVGVGVTMSCQAAIPSVVWATVWLFLCMGLLGMGNGAIFQLVPQRFPREIGVITGIVGAAGGVGGFLLPFGLKALKGMKQLDSYSYGFALFALVAVGCAVALRAVARQWEGSFVRQGGLAATEVKRYREDTALTQSLGLPVPHPIEATEPVG